MKGALIQIFYRTTQTIAIIICLSIIFIFVYNSVPRLQRTIDIMKLINKRAMLLLGAMTAFSVFFSFAQTPLISDSFEADNKTSTVLLKVIGTLSFDQTLSAVHNLTNQNDVTNINYQWFTDNQLLPGESKQKLVTTKPMIGKLIHVEVTYSQDGDIKKITAKAKHKLEGYTQYGSLLNDTGITFGTNYPMGDNIDCTGELISAQDCSSGLDSEGIGFQFVKISKAGIELSDSATNWSCVKDQRTGLIWENKTVNGLHNKDDKYTWYIRNGYLNGGAAGVQNSDQNICHGYKQGDESTYCNTQAFIDRVNNESLCGHNDWRLPYREEIRNIANLSKVNPSIDVDFFPNTMGKFYWTGSPFASSVDYAWTYDFFDGYGNFYPRSNNYRVRLVRGIP